MVSITVTMVRPCLELYMPIPWLCCHQCVVPSYSYSFPALPATSEVTPLRNCNPVLVVVLTAG